MKSEKVKKGGGGILCQINVYINCYFSANKDLFVCLLDYIVSHVSGTIINWKYFIICGSYHYCLTMPPINAKGLILI